MKNNLFSNNYRKTAFTIKLLTTIILVVSATLINNLFAQVTITVPSLTVSSCSPFPTNEGSLGNIIIAENSASDFSVIAGGTIIISAPANFEFTNAGTATASGAEMSLESSALTNSTTITLTFTVTGTVVLNSLTISGIKVRGISVATSASSVTRTGGTAIVAGDVNTTIHATVTSELNTTPTMTSTSSSTICSGASVSIVLASDVASKKVAGALKKAMNPKTGKIGVIVYGLDIPHVHIHLSN